VTTATARPAVTADRIAAEALALLDRGPDESVLTMRSLAARLGIQAPSLYAHVSGMDEIRDLVHALINSTIDVSGLDGSTDLDDLADLGRRYREAYRAHRVAASMIVSRSINRDHALRIYEPIAAFLSRYGVPAERVMPLMALFDNLVLGSAVEPFSAGFTGPARDYRASYPALADALGCIARDRVDDEAFETGMAAFLGLLRAERVTAR
jgi:AcrR family transcriptional regulator